MRARDAIIEDVCARVASGESIDGIFRNRGASYPPKGRFWQWVRENQQYRQALDAAERLRAFVFADEIISLADEKPPLVDGKVDSAWVTWQNNRVQKRQWFASRMLPRIYGDRTIVSGDPQNPISLALSVAPTLHNLSTQEKLALLSLVRKATKDEPEPAVIDGQLVEGGADADSSATPDSESS